MRPIDIDVLESVAVEYQERHSDFPLTRNEYKLIDRFLFEYPTIEAEPVKLGRWIKMTGMMPPEYHGHYECSECHWHMKGIRSSWTREEELTYCPNCGAKMDGERK